MNIISFCLSIFALKAKSFERSTLDPIKAQEKVLFEYLKRNRGTEFGLKYDFSGIKSIKDYQARVPLNDCQSLKGYLDRMTKGETNILTKDRPIFYGATSGTTAHPKLIPSTHFSESKKDDLLRIWGYYISKAHPDIFKGKILALVSPEVEGITDSGVPYGAESGHGYKQIPGIVKHIYVLPDEVFEIPDYDARYYAILRISMEHDITNIASLSPNTIILLCQKIFKWQDKLIDDIRNGTLDRTFKIPDSIRIIIEKRLKPNPGRAGSLENILAEKGELLPKYFWPNLKLIECWKGGTMRLYLKDLPGYLGDVPVRDMGCLSTEARSSIPMTDEGAGGVLAIKTNFYEFIPKEDMGKKEKRFLLCDELRAGEEYFIVVTTPGGLYRYNIDDIIRVDGFFNKTPVIEFVQKGLSATSIAGEKLYESQVNEALNRSLERCRISLDFFCASIMTSKVPHYEFLTEFANNSLSLEEKRRFLSVMDEELCRENREYDWARHSQLLGSPVLKILRKGDSEKYRIKRIKEGAQDGQYKVPELTGDPEFHKNFNFDEVVAIEDR